MTDPSPDRHAKLGEIQFLAENFDMAPAAAAGLVAEGVEADELAAVAMQGARERDPLAGMPVPSAEKDPEHLEREVADLGKPVVHKPSAPS